MANRIRASVFAKLVTIMLGMAACLLLVVVAFFILIFNPVLNTSISRLVEEHIRAFAATSPDMAAAQQFRERTGIHVRYEGPDGTSWATSDRLPPIAEARARQMRLFAGRGDYFADAPNGGHYLFSWGFGRKMIEVHHTLLLLFIVLIIAIVVVTYAVLRHLLRPVRTLGDGVARLSEGELDFVLPNRTRDEFGALTDAFNQMVRRVRDMIRARDQLLLDVSHELRSPITRLRVALALLPEDRNRAGMAADLAEMEAMIAELLELERLRDGRGIRTERQDLMPIVRDVAGGLGVDGPSTVPVDIDAEKMRTVLRNLIENAVKYSLPDSASVTVSVAVSDAVTIRVRDDGPGIPAEDVDSLFEPFFRVNRSRSKTPAGYGLGLSICKRIVEAHGGTITVENHAPRGASFIVRLPMVVG